MKDINAFIENKIKEIEDLGYALEKGGDNFYKLSKTFGLDAVLAFSIFSNQSEKIDLAINAIINYNVLSAKERLKLVKASEVANLEDEQLDVDRLKEMGLTDLASTLSSLEQKYLSEEVIKVELILEIEDGEEKSLRALGLVDWGNGKNGDDFRFEKDLKVSFSTLSELKEKIKNIYPVLELVAIQERFLS